MMAEPSPAIDQDEWGRIDVAGTTYKDVKLWPGGGRAWDWRENGTSHDGGVAAADIDEIRGRGATVIIVSTGRQGRLRVAETVGDGVEVMGTEEAIERYNQLAARGEAVGALIHSTC